jgi:DNA-binding LacI/PurR family transcriptional regulator
MARDSTTSMDVARLAGVSQSAVSRVFTPGASVSERTSQKVRDAARELGYRPNSLARAMVSGRSRIIGLVVAYLHNQFYPEALEKLSAELQFHGYHVLVFLTEREQGDVNEVIEEILGYQVDGIIAASVALSSELSDRFRAEQVPLVMFNRSQDIAGLPSVTSNNFAGGRKVADFLVAGGHKRIGYIAGWEGASTQRDREAGFLEGLMVAGQELFARGVGDFRAEVAADAARAMFAHEQIPDALFVANDHMAIAVMDVLRGELGLRIPQDVSVIGYDDAPTARLQAYDLTTVRQPAEQMAKSTVNLLLAQIEGRRDITPKVEINGPLILRGSARIPEVRQDEGF